MKIYTEIIKKTNISQGALSNIIATRRRPSWPMAKKLAKATGTSPVLWLEGSSEQIKTELQINKK